MNTKPFDIDLAKQGKKVITKSGLPVRIICFDRQHPVYPIVALLPDLEGNENVLFYPPNGRNVDDENYSLVHPFEKKERYILCSYAKIPQTSSGVSYNSYDEAANAAKFKSGRWIIVRQTWEE